MDNNNRIPVCGLTRCAEDPTSWFGRDHRDSVDRCTPTRGPPMASMTLMTSARTSDTEEEDDGAIRRRRRPGESQGAEPPRRNPEGPEAAGGARRPRGGSHHSLGGGDVRLRPSASDSRQPPSVGYGIFALGIGLSPGTPGVRRPGVKRKPTDPRAPKSISQWAKTPERKAIGTLRKWDNGQRDNVGHWGAANRSPERHPGISNHPIERQLLKTEHKV